MAHPRLTAINLNLLVTLQVLLEARSVSLAATRLHLSQPAVSRALAQLRELFEDPLLVRVGNQTTLTSAAEDILEPLRAALDAAASVLPSRSFVPEETTRAFRVLTTDYGAIACRPALDTFFRTAPRASVELLPLEGEPVDALATGRADLALYVGDDPPRGLHGQRLFRDDYVCVHRCEHPGLDTEGGLSLDAYVRYPHVLVAPFGTRSGWVDRLLEAQGKTRHVACWLPYFGAAPSLLADSDALLTVPRRVAALHDDSGRLTWSPLPFPSHAFHYQLLWHARSHGDSEVAWLRALLVAAYDTPS